MSKNFIPSDFKVPEVLETEHFRIRVLKINDVVKDYDAVMSSVDHLQGVFGPNSDWPQKDLTLEQDLIDLGWHQKEFQNRSSFAFTVVRLDESEVIGCVYFYPANKCDFDVMAIIWVRSDVVKDGLDVKLFSTVKKWIESDWPFRKVGYPGREIRWEEWQRLE